MVVVEELYLVCLSKPHFDPVGREMINLLRLAHFNHDFYIIHKYNVDLFVWQVDSDILQ